MKEWRKNAHICQSLGSQNGLEYPWIVLKDKWEETLWEDIRKDKKFSLIRYLKKNRIQNHAGTHNLKSSWTLCANLYFPFGSSPEGRKLLGSFLRRHVGAEIQCVDRLELEFAEEGSLHPSNLLGETGGKRGSGQTSPDLAFIVNDGTGLILTENKFVEHSFYPCSARTTKDNTKRKGNHDPSRCKNVKRVLAEPRGQCHQVEWNRCYWKHLKEIVNKEAWEKLAVCPAGYAGYQLFRQQALAEGIAQSAKYEFVYSCVAYDERNETLVHCLRNTGLDDFTRDWGGLFSGKAKFATWTHQQWVQWVRENAALEWKNWLEYVESRYAFSNNDL